MNGIEEELWKYITGDVRPPHVQKIGTSSNNQNVQEQAKRLQKNKKKCMRELRGALPPIVDTYVCTCETSKEIWDILQ